MFTRLKNALNALIDSLTGFRADVDETRQKWREQFHPDAREPEQLPAQVEPQRNGTARRQKV